MDNNEIKQIWYRHFRRHYRFWKLGRVYRQALKGGMCSCKAEKYAWKQVWGTPEWMFGNRLCEACEEDQGLDNYHWDYDLEEWVYD